MLIESGSNACKFTPAGGQLTITTRLMLPHRSGPSRHDSDTLTATELSKEAKELSTTSGSPSSEYKDLAEHKDRPPPLSSKHLARHNSLHNKPTPLETIIVRIEISDTGCGIKPMDMVQCKLFCMSRSSQMANIC